MLSRIGPQGPRSFCGMTTWNDGAYVIVWIAGYWTKFRNPIPRISK